MSKKTKKWEDINPKEKMQKDEFEYLFSHLPLNLYEKEKLRTEYWNVYQKFLTSDVSPVDSWLATRNLFINKEKQIGELIKEKS